MAPVADWQQAGHYAVADIWHHPDTGIEILGEDMPDELLPTRLTD